MGKTKFFVAVLLFCLMITGCSSDVAENAIYEETEKIVSDTINNITFEIEPDNYIVVSETSDFAIEVSSITYNEESTNINLSYQNKTDEVMYFSVTDGTVNNYDYSLYDYIEVSTNDESESEIVIYSQELDALGIESVDEISLYFEVYNSNFEVVRGINSVISEEETSISALALSDFINSETFLENKYASVSLISYEYNDQIASVKLLLANNTSDRMCLEFYGGNWFSVDTVPAQSEEYFILYIPVENIEVPYAFTLDISGYNADDFTDYFDEEISVSIE